MDYDDFPEEIEIEILLRLPIKSLLRFKCVTRKWCSIIQSPVFGHRYKQLSKMRNNNGKLLCHRKDPITKTHVVSVFNDQTFEKIKDLEWPPFLDEDVEGADRFLRRYVILGPVNGIYCIFRELIDRWVGTLTLWNPATREYKHIRPNVSFPFPPHLQAGMWNPNSSFEANYPQGLHIGFGFDHVAKDYKVVLICSWFSEMHHSFWDVRVYSLGSDSWKTILTVSNDVDVILAGSECVPFPFIRSYPVMDICHCLVNEVFHWPCEAYYKEEPNDYDKFGLDILAFDMATEGFKIMKGPKLTIGPIPFRQMWVYKESIAVVACADRDFEVWVMREYGVTESWELLYSFGKIIEWTSLGMPNDDQIFFEDENGQLISFSFDGEDDDDINKCGVYGVKEHIPYKLPEEIYVSLGVSKYMETLETLKEQI